MIPPCYLCGRGVTSGQTDGDGFPAHYSCLGMCTRCHERPAATPDPPHVCLACAKSTDHDEGLDP